MACPEVVTGRVAVPGEDFSRIQQEVDKGRHVWRLSPVRTTQVVGTRHLGLRTTDAYAFIEQYYDRDSGLQNAVVRVRHGSCEYFVSLYQPELQGPRGIWVVSEVTEI